MQTTLASSLFFASVALTTIACSGRSSDVIKPHQSQEESTPEIRVEDASQALLQQSVARLVAQLETDDRQVLIYQDSYSSFFDRLSKSEKDVGRVPASLIYYYTPHFIAGNIHASVADGNRMEIKVENKTSLRTLVEKVKLELKSKIGDASANSQIMQLPVSDINASVRIAGKVYQVQVAPDFSHAVISVNKNDLPEAFRNEKAIPELRKAMSLFSIKYKYWVLPFNEDQCSLGIDMKSMKSDFTATNDEKEDATTPTSLTTPTSNTANILNAAQKPVTLDLTKRAIESMKKSMDARCTSSAGGMGWESINKVLSKMFEKGTDYILGPNPNGDWDATMKAIVGQYMDPAKFTSTIDKINEDLSNKNSLATSLTKDEETRKAGRLLIENDAKHAASQASSANRSAQGSTSGSGSFLDIISADGKVSGSYNSASTNQSSNSDSSYSKRDGASNEEYINKLNQTFNQEGISANVTNIDGKIKLVPKVRITLINELNFDESILATMKATQLGVIRQQNGEATAETSEAEQVNLTIKTQCDQNAVQKIINLKSTAWTTNPNAVLEKSINSASEDLNLGKGAGCSEIRIALAITGNSEETPSAFNFNIQASSFTPPNTAIPGQYAQLLSLSRTQLEDARTFGSLNGARSNWSLKLSTATIDR
jgi:hypothetical protein